MKTYFFHPIPLTTALLAVASTCTTPKLRAQETAPQTPTQNKTQNTTQTAPTINPVARQLMVQTYNAYRALNSYSSEIAWQENDGSATKKSGTGRVSWQKPNRLLVQASTGDAVETNVLNGQKFIASRTRGVRTRYVSENSTNAKESVERALQPIDISGIGLGAGLIGRSPLQTMGSRVARVATRKATATEVQGLSEAIEALNVVEVGLQSAPNTPTLTVTFFSARADNLLRRVRVQIGSGDKAQTLTETYRKVQVNPTLDAKTFAYTPPLSAKRVSELANGYDERLEVGAEPFAIQTTAMDGRKISLGDYKNRVLLLDFWATWCPPCREEMPNVIANYRKYHRRGFDVLGVSLDQSQSALQSYLKQNKMPWRQIFDGKGWQSTLAGNYGVQAIPFTLLIGRDGKIAAVNPRGPQLQTAIKAALAKKAKG